MSQPPRERAPERKTAANRTRPVGQQAAPKGPPLRNSRPPAQSAPPAPPPRRPEGTLGAERRRRSTYAYEPPRRDIFPYVMSGIMGALVVGLVITIFLLLNRPAQPISP